MPAKQTKSRPRNQQKQSQFHLHQPQPPQQLPHHLLTHQPLQPISFNYVIIDLHSIFLKSYISIISIILPFHFHINLIFVSQMKVLLETQFPFEKAFWMIFFPVIYSSPLFTKKARLFFCAIKLISQNVP